MFSDFGEALPSLLPSATKIGPYNNLRVMCRGGFLFEAPPDALLNGFRVDEYSTGNVLPCPFSLTSPNLSDVPFCYSCANNRGVARSYKGIETVSEDAAELLGWLTCSSSLSSETQSLRFSNSDPWSLTRVESLCQKCFPTVKVTYYPKNIGFDLTLTGGIDNPLRHFIRKMRMVEGFPSSVFLFSKEGKCAFLRGLWGAHGWVHTRKGGNDVDMGLKRTENPAFTSMLRELHLFIGMHGQSRPAPTRENKKLHRLVFSGYANYERFFSDVGQVGEKVLPAAPIRRKREQPSVYQFLRGFFYHMPIQKITKVKDKEETWLTMK